MTNFLSRVRRWVIVLGMMWMGREVRAQDTPSLYFDVVYWGSWMDRPLKYKCGKELKVIPLPAGNSTAFFYRGPSPIVFYREETTDPKTGEMKPVPVLTVGFDPTWKRAILLVIPNPAAKDAVRASFLPLTDKDFPTDTALLMNGSAKKLKNRLGKTDFTLAPKQRQLAPLTTGKTHLMAAAEWKGNWQVMHTDTFKPVEGERRLIFFYTPDQTENVTPFVLVIPPDSIRFDAEGKPRESLSADPDFKPGDNPTGMGKYIPEP